MADGISQTRADAHLADYTGCYLQLHTADPGAAGTTAVSTAAANREQVSWGAVATSGTTRRRLNNAIVRWDAGDVTGSQACTHGSYWTAASAGTFLGSFPLDATLNLVSGTAAEADVGALEVNIGPVAA